MMTITEATARNIGTTGDTDGAVMHQRTFLRVTDIARLWGQERARARYREQCRADGRQPEPGEEAAAVDAAGPVAVRTVYAYRRESLRGRYRDNPMPLGVYPDEQPKRGQIPVWAPEEGETLAELEQRVRAWWHTRPGPGAGGGRPRKNPEGRRRG